MSVKIAVTVADCGMAVNIGGPINVSTAIIELTDEQVPRILRRYLDDLRRVRQSAEEGERNGKPCRDYLLKAVAVSLVDEVK